MTYSDSHKISPRTTLITAFILHGSVEIPFFIFPVILLLVGGDLFPSTEIWIGLGSLGTIGYLAAGLPSPIFGHFAEKRRNGPMMITSLLLSCFGSFLIGMYGNSFVIIIIGMTMLGLAMALYHPQGLSWITHAFEDPDTGSYSSKYVRILSLHGIGGTFGAAIGPLSVFFLIDIISWREIYLFWSFPLLLIAIGSWFFVIRHEPRKTNVILSEGSLNNPKVEHRSDKYYLILVLIFAFITTLSLSRGMINFILSPFLSEMKNIEISTAALFIGVSTLLGASGEITGGVIGDKFGERTVLSSFALTQIIILVIIYVIDVRTILFLCYICYGISSSLFWPSTNSVVVKHSNHRGRAFGWVMLIAHFSGALGPTIDGIIISFDPNRYLLIFIFAIAFSIAGFFFVVISGRVSKFNKFNRNIVHKKS
ncbi:MAG: MFS transporter [Candidatus Kariarchaeaceae archaeon]